MKREGVLVVCLPAVGDFIRCLTAVQMIAARHPGEPIDVLGSPPGTVAGQYSPYIRHVYELRRRAGKLDLDVRFKVAREIRQARHAVAYVLATNFKAALVPFLAGIPRRIGWFGEFRYPLINRPRFGLDRNDPPLLQEQGSLLLGHRVPDLTALPAPELSVPSSETDACRREFGIAPGQRVVAMVANEGRRALSVEKLIDLARRCREAGWDVWMIGADRDRLATSQVCANVAGVRDMTHSTLRESIVRIAAADVFVGTDTGLIHVAAALGGPVVAIFSSWFRTHSGPINRNVHYIIDPLADHRIHHEPGSLTAEVPVDRIFDEVRSILADA